MFSIADVQAEEDLEELESDSESDVDDSPAPYPVRASLTITKVLISSHIVPELFLTPTFIIY